MHISAFLVRSGQTQPSISGEQTHISYVVFNLTDSNLTVEFQGWNEPHI